MADDGEPESTATPKSQIQAVDRSVALLDAVARSGPQGALLRELAQAVDLNPSTARTILAALVTHGFVTQYGESRRYRLGSRVFALGQIYMTHTDLTVVAGPIVHQLWETTAETVHLAVLEGSRRVDVSVLVGPQLLNINPGSRVVRGAFTPLEHTAAGKVLLAGLDAEELTAVRRADWQNFPAQPRPVTAAVVEMLAQVRNLGYATNVEEGAVGVCGVAAPVFDRTGRTIAALCIGYPTARHSEEHAEALRKYACDAAAELSALMGWHATEGIGA